ALYAPRSTARTASSPSSRTEHLRETFTSAALPRNLRSRRLGPSARPGTCPPSRLGSRHRPLCEACMAPSAPSVIDDNGPPPSAAAKFTSSYSDLARQVREAGLLRRAYGYY